MDKSVNRIARLRESVEADGGPAEFAKQRSQQGADKPKIDPPLGGFYFALKKISKRYCIVG